MIENQPSLEPLRKCKSRSNIEPWFVHISDKVVYSDFKNHRDSRSKLLDSPVEVTKWLWRMGNKYSKNSWNRIFERKKLMENRKEISIFVKRSLRNVENKNNCLEVKKFVNNICLKLIYLDEERRYIHKIVKNLLTFKIEKKISERNDEEYISLYIKNALSDFKRKKEHELSSIFNDVKMVLSNSVIKKIEEINDFEKVTLFVNKIVENVEDENNKILCCQFVSNIFQKLIKKDNEKRYIEKYFKKILNEKIFGSVEKISLFVKKCFVSVEKRINNEKKVKKFVENCMKNVERKIDEENTIRNIVINCYLNVEKFITEKNNQRIISIYVQEIMRKCINDEENNIKVREFVKGCLGNVIDYQNKKEISLFVTRVLINVDNKEFGRLLVKKTLKNVEKNIIQKWEVSEFVKKILQKVEIDENIRLFVKGIMKCVEKSVKQRIEVSKLVQMMLKNVETKIKQKQEVSDFVKDVFRNVGIIIKQRKEVSTFVNVCINNVIEKTNRSEVSNFVGNIMQKLISKDKERKFMFRELKKSVSMSFIGKFEEHNDQKMISSFLSRLFRKMVNIDEERREMKGLLSGIINGKLLSAIDRKENENYIKTVVNEIVINFFETKKKEIIYVSNSITEKITMDVMTKIQKRFNRKVVTIFVKDCITNVENKNNRKEISEFVKSTLERVEISVFVGNVMKKWMEKKIIKEFCEKHVIVNSHNGLFDQIDKVELERIRLIQKVKKMKEEFRKKTIHYFVKNLLENYVKEENERELQKKLEEEERERKRKLEEEEKERKRILEEEEREKKRIELIKLRELKIAQTISQFTRNLLQKVIDDDKMRKDFVKEKEDKEIIRIFIFNILSKIISNVMRQIENGNRQYVETWTKNILSKVVKKNQEREDKQKICKFVQKLFVKVIKDDEKRRIKHRKLYIKQFTKKILDRVIEREYKRREMELEKGNEMIKKMEEMLKKKDNEVKKRSLLIKRRLKFIRTKAESLILTQEKVFKNIIKLRKNSIKKRELERIEEIQTRKKPEIPDETNVVDDSTQSVKRDDIGEDIFKDYKFESSPMSDDEKNGELLKKSTEELKTTIVEEELPSKVEFCSILKQKKIEDEKKKERRKEELKKKKLIVQKEHITKVAEFGPISIDKKIDEKKPKELSIKETTTKETVIEKELTTKSELSLGLMDEKFDKEKGNMTKKPIQEEIKKNMIEKEPPIKAEFNSISVEKEIDDKKKSEFIKSLKEEIVIEKELTTKSELSSVLMDEKFDEEKGNLTKKSTQEEIKKNMIEKELPTKTEFSSLSVEKEIDDEKKSELTKIVIEKDLSTKSELSSVSMDEKFDKEKGNMIRKPIQEEIKKIMIEKEPPIKAEFISISVEKEIDDKKKSEFIKESLKEELTKIVIEKELTSKIQFCSLVEISESFSFNESNPKLFDIIVECRDATKRIEVVLKEINILNDLHEEFQSFSSSLDFYKVKSDMKDLPKKKDLFTEKIILDHGKEQIETAQSSKELLKIGKDSESILPEMIDLDLSKGFNILTNPSLNEEDCDEITFECFIKHKRLLNLEYKKDNGVELKTDTKEEVKHPIQKDVIVQDKSPIKTTNDKMKETIKEVKTEEKDSREDDLKKDENILVGKDNLPTFESSKIDKVTPETKDEQKMEQIPSTSVIEEDKSDVREKSSTDIIEKKIESKKDVDTIKKKDEKQIKEDMIVTKPSDKEKEEEVIEEDKLKIYENPAKDENDCDEEIVMYLYRIKKLFDISQKDEKVKDQIEEVRKDLPAKADNDLDDEDIIEGKVVKKKLEKEYDRFEGKGFKDMGLPAKDDVDLEDEDINDIVKREKFKEFDDQKSSKDNKYERRGFTRLGNPALDDHDDHNEDQSNFFIKHQEYFVKKVVKDTIYGAEKIEQFVKDTVYEEYPVEFEIQKQLDVEYQNRMKLIIDKVSEGGEKIYMKIELLQDLVVEKEEKFREELFNLQEKELNLDEISIEVIEKEKSVEKIKEMEKRKFQSTLVKKRQLKKCNFVDIEFGFPLKKEEKKYDEYKDEDEDDEEFLLSDLFLELNVNYRKSKKLKKPKPLYVPLFRSFAKFLSVSTLYNQIEIEKKPIRILFLGDRDVKKTQLLYRAIGKKFIPKSQPFLDYYNINLLLKKKKYTVKTYDVTDNMDYYNVLRHKFFSEKSDIDIICLCFSVIKPQSFLSLKNKWFGLVKGHHKEIPVILVGTELQNRYNGIANLSVSRSVVESFRKKIKAKKYIECSDTETLSCKNVLLRIIKMCKKIQS